ncbi:hypothetical protein Ciccas_003549 [Cichlidogyrus casuarinus]|uniref:Uncharacterized protein n=1 Tax=Cichlidogyrus casuarinus TaxID=1844966 RepID=A0ABD2QEH2_9PLAT
MAKIGRLLGLLDGKQQAEAEETKNARSLSTLSNAPSTVSKQAKSSPPNGETEFLFAAKKIANAKKKQELIQAIVDIGQSLGILDEKQCVSLPLSNFFPI